MLIYNNMVFNIIKSIINIISWTLTQGTHTQNVERMWSSAKWGNKKRRGTDRNFLDLYLQNLCGD
ncbi:DDE Tnp IS1595 domain-containing protein [Aphis craccivora]|uniref:DDE Tnp IS1595 domain-containing protein n=1 Tax=Aphis craccivora TaxID=307492 RepID=A0A6G0ZSG1_APHCR|nr:DDE Tnp IS1595 domain-containing protein [Aphis craccivora]